MSVSGMEVSMGHRVMGVWSWGIARQSGPRHGERGMDHVGCTSVAPLARRWWGHSSVKGLG